MTSDNQDIEGRERGLYLSPSRAASRADSDSVAPEVVPARCLAAGAGHSWGRWGLTEVRADMLPPPSGERQPRRAQCWQAETLATGRTEFVPAVRQHGPGPTAAAAECS